MHQSPRHIPLALTSNSIRDEIKKAIAITLLKHPKTDVDKPEPPKVYEDSTVLCMGSSVMNHEYIVF